MEDPVEIEGVALEHKTNAGPDASGFRIRGASTLSTNNAHRSRISGCRRRHVVVGLPIRKRGFKRYFFIATYL